MDAYVLVHQAEDDVIDRLEAVEEVRFAARTVGAHVAVAVVSAPAITDVVALVEYTHRWGVVAHETVVPLRPNPPSIKGLRPEKHEAFVGLTVSPPYDRIQGAVEALRRLDTVVAVHAVAGRYQVMAELASQDYHELRDALLLDVPSVAGVTSITTSLAVFYNAPPSLQASPGGMDWFWREPGQPRPHWGPAASPEPRPRRTGRRTSRRTPWPRCARRSRSCSATWSARRRSASGSTPSPCES